MKILHTSDLHLKETDERRWYALEVVLETAKKQNVQALCISGDMFDAEIDAEKSKMRLRGIFNDYRFNVIIIPGNHDRDSIEEQDYLGDRVKVLSNSGSYLDLQEVRFVALPFEEKDSESVMLELLKLRDCIKEGTTNILLYHGELLDISYRKGAYGDEDLSKYMPAKLDFFDGLGFDYILAGHFHSNFFVRKKNNWFFIYPGSPVAITRREEGVRKVNLFDTGQTPQECPVDTFHYEEVKVELDPFAAEDPLQKIEESMQQRNPAAEINLIIEGFVNLDELNMSEIEFNKRIDNLIPPSGVKVDPLWVDIQKVLSNDLFRRFMTILEERVEEKESKVRMRKLAIEAMRKVLSAR